MKVAAARPQAYRLPLRGRWATAAGGFSVRQGWLLRLESDDGRHGYGDCAPLPMTGTESLAEAENALRVQSRRIVGMRVEEALAALGGPAAAGAPAARCAVECALLDLLAQALHLPLHRYLAAGTAGEVRVNAALGNPLQTGDDTILTACAQGFDVLKFKVATAPPDGELARLHEIAALLPPGTSLRLDANRAWRGDDAARFVDRCAALPVDMLEEPLADPRPAALGRLQARCAFPLALDESVPGRISVDTLLAAPPVRRLVLKPPRLGGLLPALALARRARAAGLECVVTGSVDSACGVMAAAHLAAALGNGLAHGLATSAWLAEDLGAAPETGGGWMKLADTPGLGFTPAGGQQRQ